MKKPIFKQLIEWIFSAVFIGVYFVLLFNAFPIVILITIYALSYEPKKPEKILKKLVANTKNTQEDLIKVTSLQKEVRERIKCTRS